MKQTGEGYQLPFRQSGLSDQHARRTAGGRAETLTLRRGKQMVRRRPTRSGRSPVQTHNGR